MNHVIEIDQQDNLNLFEEQALLVPKVEVPVKTLMEASNVPELELELVEITPEETAHVVPSEESLSSEETAVLEEQLIETLNSAVVVDSEVQSEQE